MVIRNDGGSWQDHFLYAHHDNWGLCVAHLCSLSLQPLLSCCVEAIECKYCPGKGPEHTAKDLKCLYGALHFESISDSQLIRDHLAYVIKWCPRG